MILDMYDDGFEKISKEKFFCGNDLSVCIDTWKVSEKVSY